MSTVVKDALEKLAARKAATAPGVAKGLVTNPASSALALLIAAKELVGDWTTWEPESLWLSLNEMGIAVPTENRVKLQAAATLLAVPSFYWDGFVFEKTALAFDGHEPNPDTLEEATVAQLAWAVVEAEQVIAYYGDPMLRPGDEPRAYSAVVLQREGFVLAPEQLTFAQGALDTMNRGIPVELRDSVAAVWQTIDKSKLVDRTFEESPRDVQLARLAAVEVHVQAKEKQLAEDLAALRG